MLILKCLAGKNRRVTIVVGSKNMWKAKIAKVKHRQPNVMVACAQAHMAQAMDCIVVLYYGCLRHMCLCAGNHNIGLPMGKEIKIDLAYF
jgi:hypothetical protein